MKTRKITVAIMTVVCLFFAVQLVRACVTGGFNIEVPEGLFEEESDTVLGEVIKETVSENDFADGKGIISITCGPIASDSGETAETGTTPDRCVNIFVNGTIEASLKSGETKTFRVAVGDVILAMGRGLVSPVRVTITTAVGRIDCSILNESLEVGNKGKLLTVIKKFDI